MQKGGNERLEGFVEERASSRNGELQIGTRLKSLRRKRKLSGFVPEHAANMAFELISFGCASCCARDMPMCAFDNCFPIKRWNCVVSSPLLQTIRPRKSH